MTEIKEINGVLLENAFLKIKDNIGIITLHNPPVNACSYKMQRDILLICEYINSCDDIYVAILHSDIKTFCVGVDIKRFKQSIDDKDVTNVQEMYYDSALAMYEMKVPLITAVHGHCLGGGLCYPAGSDITIAATGTKFGIPEVTLSVVGGSGHLSRILPPMIMRDMAFTGKFMAAEDLIKFGGVTEIVEQDKLMERAFEKAYELIKKGPLILKYLKQCMNLQEDFEMKRKNDLEVTYTRYMARHNDFNEGVSAFLQKRVPNYKGE